MVQIETRLKNILDKTEIVWDIGKPLRDSGRYNMAKCKQV